MSDEPGGFLQVGTDGRGQVVISLDRDRTGHIVFSQDEARALASLLFKKAAEAEYNPLLAACEGLIRLWDDANPDDPCACLGASPDCPYPPVCELCAAREAVRVARGA